MKQEIHINQNNKSKMQKISTTSVIQDQLEKSQKFIVYQNNTYSTETSTTLGNMYRYLQHYLCVLWQWNSGTFPVQNKTNVIIPFYYYSVRKLQTVITGS